jgi:cytochrome c oxidase assembly protein subunit 19
MQSAFQQKRLQLIPPEKGSFPLDHEGACKKQFLIYMNCLRENKGENSLCRIESKDYLACRMDNNLMAPESWQKLGFQEEKVENKKA